MYHYTDGGLRNIWLANGYTVKKTSYGQAVAIQDLPGLICAIGKALIVKKTRLTAAEFRYLRQAMLMSQASLGKALGRSDQAVALWEKTGKVPKFADLMTRVMFALHANGNEQVKNLVAALNDVDRCVNVVMKDTASGWTSEESDEAIPTDQELTLV